MADENKDLAVLGFSVKAESAMQALEQLDAKLRNIDDNFKKADAALERKIVSTLAAIEKPMGKLDRTSAVVASFGEAFKQFAATAKTEGIADALHLVTTSIEALSKSGLEKVAATYAKSLGAATMAFGQLGDSVTHTVGGISAIMSGAFDAKNADALKNYIKSLSDAKEMLSGYTNEFGAKKLPFGVTVTNIKAAQRELESMITTAQTYADLLDPNNKRTKIDIKNSANALLSQFQKQQEYVHNAMMGLFPNGGTVKISAELVNAEQITAALPKTIQVSIEQTSKEMLTQFFTSIDEMKKGLNEIHVDVPQADLDKIKNKIDNAVEATIMFQSGAEESLSRSFEYIKKSIEKKAQIVIPIALVDANGVQVEQPAEAVKELVQEVEKAVDEEAKKAAENPPPNLEQLRAKWRAGIFETLIEDKPGVLRKMEERGQMFREDIFDPAMEGNEKAIERLKKLMSAIGYRHNDVEVMLSETLPGSTQKAAQEAEKAVEQVARKVSEAPEKVAQAAIGKADVVLGKFMERIQPQASKIGEMLTFQPTLPENWQETIKAQIQAFKSVAIETVTVSPKTLTVDTSSSVAKLMNEPLHVKGANVMVHPAAIKVDTAFVNPEAVKLIGGVQETLEKTVNVDPHVKAIEKVADTYKVFLDAAESLEDKLKGISKLLTTDMKALFKASIKSGKTESTLDKLYRESEAAERLQQEIEQGQELVRTMMGPVNRGPSNARNSHWETMEEDLTKIEKASGKFAANQSKQYEEAERVQKKFANGLDDITDAVKKTGEETARESEKIRANARAWLENSRAASNMRVESVALGCELQRVGWRIDNIPRIEPTKLVDPFIRMKAEIGETNSRLIDFGRTLGIYFSGRTIINYFRQAAESANTFGMEIRRIQSLATDFDFSNLKNELMDIDARFGSVVHNANALYWAFSSGVRGSERDLANFTEIMSKTATTIKSDIMPTVDAATSVMNAWNLTAGSAGEIGDLLFSIIKYGKSNASQLTTALGHVVAPAAALNLNLDELGASIATLTKTMKTNRALTYLSNILGKMASPTKKVQEAAAEFGIELSANAIKARGFAQTLRDIREATGGDVGKIAKLFPDLRGQRAAITLLSTQYADFEKQLDNMRGKAGAMEEALGKITNSPEAQIKALKNTISMVSIYAGDAANNVLTLGGALGPILKTVNGLEHGGRELLGHLVAAAGAMGGIVVSMKVIQAARFATAQATYQMAAADTETHRLEMDNAMLAEQRALESVNSLKANMQQTVVEKQLNDEVLRELRNREEILSATMKTAQVDLRRNQSNVKFLNESIKMQFAERVAQTGEKQNRVSSLQSWLTRLTTGEDQQKIRSALNLVERLNADIQIDNASLKGQRQDLLNVYTKQVENLVEKNEEVKKAFQDAMLSGNLGEAEKQDTLLGKIASLIKRDTIIAGQISQFDEGEKLLQREVRRVLLATKQKELVSGINYENSLLVQMVKDELKLAQDNLQVDQNRLRNMIQQSGVSEEAKALMESIAKQTMDIQAIDAERVALQNQITDRTRELTGRTQDQVKMLDAAAKAAKELLAQDTTDLNVLKNKAEIELKNAAVIGPKTLAATKSALAVEMESHSVLMKINALDAERNTLIDKEGRMINESAEAVARVAEIDKERNQLLAKRNALQREFVSLGIAAGNQDARNLKILEMNNSGIGLSDAVGRLARDKGVVSEAVKRMSSEIGKNLFGGMLGGKGAMGLSMLTPFVPGMGRWGMAASMLASFNVFGKAASGMSRLTSSTLRLMGTTEKLQKQGILQLDKGVEDLTRSLLTSRLTLKGFKASMDAIAESGKGGALAASMGWKAGLVVGIGALVGTLIYKGLAAYYKGHQGPFDELAEKMYGVGDSKGYGEMLQMRIDRMKQERQTNEEMQRELRRMLQIQKERFTDLEEQKTILSNMNSIQEAIRKLEKIDGLEKLRDDITATVKNLNAMQADLTSLTSWLQEMLFARQHYVANYDEIVAELQKSIPEEKAKLDQLEGSLSDRFKTLFLGGAEYRYQALYELLESDRSSALTPALDAQGKMGMAEKMVKMSVGRIASLLKLDDLAGQSTDQIREMIRTRESKLSIAYDAAQTKLINAQIGLKDPKLIKDEKKFKEAEENVRKLEEAANAAKKELDDFESNIRSSMSDFYTKVIARAEALVNQTLETVKKNNKEVKYLNTRWNADWSFMNISHNIEIIKTAIEKITEDYRNGVGIFRELNQPEREQVFKSQVEKLTDSLHEQVISRVTALKGAMDSIAGLMTSISNDAFSGSKSLFDFRMNAPEYAWMRPQLIRQRMKMLNQLLQGENGAYAQRLKAFDTMNLRMDIKDYAGAAKALSDAQAYGKTALGYEREKYELIKRQADIERNINSSMFQLANTLQGQFAATSQTAVDVFSVESVRLQMRRIGENIAPAIDTSVQTKEQQFYEQLMEKDRQFGRDLMMAGERLNQRLQDEANNARMQAGAAKTMSDAATKIDGAAHTFERTMNSQKTMIRVKRI